ncbi:MAG: hypothetical protein J6W64_09600 [Bacilli bacterium]|nr:hypothetical protein [Bacilli bacterium]
MKRLLNLFFVLVVGFIMALPLAVNAEEVTFDATKNCETPDADGYCSTSVVLGMKDITSALNNVEITINFNSSEVVYGSFKGQNGWENVGETKISNKTIKLLFKNLSGDVTSSTTTFGTFVFKYPSTLTELDCSATINGVTIKTTTETTTETKETTNPSTGASLPVVILASGAAVAGVVYYVSKRNTKMYKI